MLQINERDTNDLEIPFEMLISKSDLDCSTQVPSVSRSELTKKSRSATPSFVSVSEQLDSDVAVSALLLVLEL